MNLTYRPRIEARLDKKILQKDRLPDLNVPNSES
jgi:hypothetical protein